MRSPHRRRAGLLHRMGPTRIDLDEPKKTTIAAQVRQYLDACVGAAERTLLGQDGVPTRGPARWRLDRSVSFCLEPLEVESGRFRCLEDLRSAIGVSGPGPRRAPRL